jgi:hypothetical protein
MFFWNSTAVGQVERVLVDRRERLPQAKCRLEAGQQVRHVLADEHALGHLERVEA